MTPNAWASLAVLAAVFLTLVFSKRGPDIILFGGLALLVVSGVVSPAAAFSGFSNEGVLTLAVLSVVAAGMRESGGIWLAVSKWFTRPSSLRGAQARIMFPVAAFSAFLNNTPLVLMILPVVMDWSRKFDLQPSKLLIPLSYASVLGGTITLIGTSTNLVVNGLIIEAGLPSLSLFSLAPVGIPLALSGILYMLTIGSKLLPNRQAPRSTFDDPRSYMVEMVVEEPGPLGGQTIEAAGLRHLPGLYLMEISRNGSILPAVGPETKLQAGDQLVFTGVVDSIVDLQKIRGLKPATDQVFKLNSPRSQRCLIEAVVSNTSPHVGRSIRESRFRTAYDAVVIAVARGGQRVRKKIGDIVLEPGDTLLLEAMPSFIDRHKNSREFYLVSGIDGSSPPDHDKAWVALAILAGLVVLVTAGVLTMLQASLLAAGAMLLTRVLSGEQARRSLDLRLLVAIAAAFGMGRALQETGAATAIAGQIVELVAGNLMLSLVAIYLTAMFFTEVITNNAAAALVFPVALATAQSLGANPLPFLIAIMFAASASFSSPLGYQTHLMVYGPGGYRFSDFLKVGLPLNIIVATIAILLIPIFWPF